MRRAPGWTRLAGIALELGALAYLAYVLMGRASTGSAPLDFARGRSIPHDDNPVTPPTATSETPAAQAVFSEPMDFITEASDEGARYYRAADDGVELYAGFYSDGRLRLADAQNRRFAGMLQGSHADLLELDNNQWSEVFLRITPTGRMQLELRGGPYDSHVLSCERVKE